MNAKTASLYMQAASCGMLLFALIQLSNDTAPAFATLLQGRVEHQAEGLSAEVKDSLNESFPKEFEGNWHCVTTVTDSAVADVTPGSVTECNLQFKKTPDGRILAHWSQPGWTESQSSIITFSKSEAQLDRTAYYWGDGHNGSWAARTRDNFQLTPTGTIMTNSYVDQYIDGSYLGRYKTSSLLTKADAPPTTAMLPPTR